VLRSQDFHRIAEYLRSRRDLGQKPAVRPAEAKLAVGLSIELVALLVDGAMVPTTEQGQIRERRGASLCPVTDVMSLAESRSAAREAAAAVAMMKRPP
jgi:hypothetical protein